MRSNIESGMGREKPPGVPFARIITRGNIVAQNGRPMLEHTADADVVAQQLKAGVNFAKHTNTRNDSRGAFPEKEMNLVSLREIRKNTQVLYNDCAWVNEQYFGHEKPEQVSVTQAEDLSLITTWLPSYLIYRARDPIEPHNLPNNIADLSKATDGIRATTNIMRHDVGETIVDATMIYDYANTPLASGKPVLVGDDVCPANRLEIVQTTDALLYRKSGDARRSTLDEYIVPGEFPKVQKFSKVAGDIEDVYDASVNIIRKKKAEIKRLIATGIDPKTPHIVATQAAIDVINNEFILAAFAAEESFNTILERDTARIMPLNQ